MKKRTKLYILGGLWVILGWVILANLRQSPQLIGVFSGSQKYLPLEVDNPTLRLDLLEKIRKLEYTGSHRNIFNAAPVAVARPVEPQRPVEQVQEVKVEPPLTLPFKFYGLVTEPRSGKRRACFTNGDDVWIIGEGETLLNRFRLLRIGNTTADFEEVSSAKRATLPLEEQAAPQG